MELGKRGEKAIRKLEEAIDLIDELGRIIGTLRPGDKITPGILHGLYVNAMLAREKVVEARMILSGYGEES